jgi:hypothetical protein
MWTRHLVLERGLGRRRISWSPDCQLVKKSLLHAVNENWHLMHFPEYFRITRDIFLVNQRELNYMRVQTVLHIWSSYIYIVFIVNRSSGTLGNNHDACAFAVNFPHLVRGWQHITKQRGATSCHCRAPVSNGFLNRAALPCAMMELAKCKLIS